VPEKSYFGYFERGGGVGGPVWERENCKKKGGIGRGGGETAVEQWLRCCATNRKVAGSIADRVIGIYH